MHFLYFCTLCLCLSLQPVIISGQALVAVSSTGARSGAHMPQGVWSPPLPVNSTFLIQMKNISFNDIKKSDFTYYVLDADAAGFSPAQVAELKAQNKTLLAYISLGQAERSRRYWMPFWSEPDNTPDFFVQPIEAESSYTGKYRVQFWEPQWQRIVLRFMREHVIPLGYSGLFFDDADTYQYFTDDTTFNATASIINFIRLARTQARTLAPDTLIFVNNVPELYESSVFRGLVDGLGITDTWYQNDTDQSRPNPQLLENVLKYTRQAKKEGKTILAVDFPTQAENICSFYAKCRAEGFVCEVTDYAMSGLTRICIRRPSEPWNIATDTNIAAKYPTSSGTSTTARPASDATRLARSCLFLFLALIANAVHH